MEIELMGFSAQTILIKFHLKQHISLIFVAFKTINVLISCSAAVMIQLGTTTKSKSPHHRHAQSLTTSQATWASNISRDFYTSYSLLWLAANVQNNTILVFQYLIMHSSWFVIRYLFFPD